METLGFQIQLSSLNILSSQNSLSKFSICHKDQNETGGKWLDVRIKRRSVREGCHSPDSSCSRQSQQDEGGSSALDETLRLKGGQTCLLAKRLLSCFDFGSDFQEEMCERWGPVPGRNIQKGVESTK